MRRLALTLLVAAMTTSIYAQENVAVDTIIYEVVEEMPRFPGCEQLDTTEVVKRQCAQQQLLNFVYGNISYPMEARLNGNEGQVVVNFVVEKDGSISNPNIVKDIGGGCGLEVLRVINLMNQAGAQWRPGMIGGEPVRARFNLPVRFRLEEAPPYTMVGADTVYTTFDQPLEFKGGDEALLTFLDEQLDYPEVGNDSCLIGTMDVQVLVEPDGKVRILNITDYANLGFDFWYAATNAATSTIGKWNAAVFEGRKVPAAYDLSMYFQPTTAACETKVEDYNKASNLMDEGLKMFEEGQEEEALAKMTEAVDMFPNDAGFLYLRGQTYLDANRLPEACQDLTRARDIALTDWFDGVLPIICR